MIVVESIRLRIRIRRGWRAWDLVRTLGPASEINHPTAFGAERKMRQVVQGSALERLAANRTTPANHPPELPDPPDEAEPPEPEPELLDGWLDPDSDCFVDEDDDEDDDDDDDDDDSEDDPLELSLSALAAFL